MKRKPFKYYDGKTVKVGDLIVGGWCGTCKIIKIEKNRIISKNILQGGIFDLYDYTQNCDLLGRKEVDRVS